MFGLLCACVLQTDGPARAGAGQEVETRQAAADGRRRPSRPESAGPVARQLHKTTQTRQLIRQSTGQPPGPPLVWMATYLENPPSWHPRHPDDPHDPDDPDDPDDLDESDDPDDPDDPVDPGDPDYSDDQDKPDDTDDADDSDDPENPDDTDDPDDPDDQDDPDDPRPDDQDDPDDTDHHPARFQNNHGSRVLCFRKQELPRSTGHRG